ncbi:hypothetical protein [Pseudonocardia yuanmonensis]|uniref:hypothetical protein n=1 Tax=Pseudonocardia yuanmonensis TaxID=1095914 RepID=UPI0031EF041A
MLVSPEMGNHDLAAISRRVPTVLVGSELHAESVDSVRADDRRGIALAVEHLVAAGHRDIHYVDGGRAIMSDTRREGYLEAMAATGSPRMPGSCRGTPTRSPVSPRPPTCWPPPNGRRRSWRTTT